MDLPPPGARLGHVDDLPEQGGREAEWSGAPLFFVRKDDDVRCFINICSHAGRALSLPDGRIFLHKGEHILCPVHGATFDVLTGACTGGPAGDPLKSVPVEIRNGEIYAA